MKKILNSYEEIRDALMSGREISLEISAEFEDAHETVTEPTTTCIGELVEKNGCKGIYAGEYERKPLILALNDLPQKQTWDEAIKSAPKGWRLPSRIEWLIMLENKEKINDALENHGGKKLSEDDWYWSSSESSRNSAWYVGATNGRVDWYGKDYSYNYVRCVLA